MIVNVWSQKLAPTHYQYLEYVITTHFELNSSLLEHLKTGDKCHAIIDPLGDLITEVGDLRFDSM